MSKKSHFRRPFDKWHGERAETLLKSERHHLYHIYWYLWRQLRLKTSLRGICKILGLFVNPLTADDKYSLLKRGNFLKHFQMDLSQKRKRISVFFFFLHFLNLDSITNNLKKKMALLAHVFWKLRTKKSVVR